MRLIPEEIQKYKEWLYRWHTPAEMKEYVEDIMNRLGGEDFSTQAGLEFVRESWVSAKFADRRRASTVRLINGERPDFALRVGDEPESCYELVEADIPKRKRGDEYKNAPDIDDWPVEEWGTEDLTFKAIQAATYKKAGKAKNLQEKSIPYPLGTGLLIYLNIEDFGTRQRDIEAIFVIAAEPAKEWFSSIWILWQFRAYQVY